MSEKLTITVSDWVANEILLQMNLKGATNKSEYVEELIRLGFAAEEQKRRMKE